MVLSTRAENSNCPRRSSCNVSLFNTKGEILQYWRNTRYKGSKKDKFFTRCFSKNLLRQVQMTFKIGFFFLHKMKSFEKLLRYFSFLCLSVLVTNLQHFETSWTQFDKSFLSKFFYSQEFTFKTVLFFWVYCASYLSNQKITLDKNSPLLKL